MNDAEQELKTGFLDEALLLLIDAEQCFLSLETSPGDPSLLEKIFRVTHNLKGSASAVGFPGLGEFTHQLESYLLKLKDGVIPVHSGSVGLLLRCNDHLLKIVTGLKLDFSAQFDSKDLLAEISSQLAVSNSVPHSPRNSKIETAPLAPEAQRQAPQEESIRVSLAQVEKLQGFVGELVLLQTLLKKQVHQPEAPLQTTLQQLEKVTQEIQKISLGLRMVSFKQTFQKMARIVRDTSAALNKKVTLTVQGEDIELDKTVLDCLGDPLVHLIRNAVDHGIEAPGARIHQGKPETGQIHLHAYRELGSLVIDIQDDGAGLDALQLTTTAIKKGILKPGTVLPEKEAHELIFAAGFSTKAEVTEISGRGIGMDVVRTHIACLQGEIHIQTAPGKGTLFRIRLPQQD